MSGNLKLNTSLGGSISLAPTNTASDVVVTVPAVNGSFVTADASGNVGIGTSSPAVKLDVVGGSVRINEDGAGTKVIALRSNYAGLGPAINVTTNDPLLFLTNNTERGRFNTSGQWLLGTNSVLGTNSRFALQFAGGGAEYGMTMRPVTNSTVAIEFQNAAGGGIGAVAITSTGTSFNTTSDYRLKENVAPMNGALEKVAALKPCTYTWKADGSAGQGFIAHELQAVVPDCVTGEKDAVDAEGKPQYQGIDVSFLVATLTAAIQEQQAIITQLQADVAALQGAA